VAVDGDGNTDVIEEPLQKWWNLRVAVAGAVEPEVAPGKPPGVDVKTRSGLPGDEPGHCFGARLDASAVEGQETHGPGDMQPLVCRGVLCHGI
jgi:hypothetical protein